MLPVLPSGTFHQKVKKRRFMMGLRPLQNALYAVIGGGGIIPYGQARER